MRFIAPDDGFLDLDEWLSRANALLPADEPHQVCLKMAAEQGKNPSDVCVCGLLRTPARCTKPCCAGWQGDER